MQSNTPLPDSEPLAFTFVTKLQITLGSFTNTLSETSFPGLWVGETHPYKILGRRTMPYWDCRVLGF